MKFQSYKLCQLALIAAVSLSFKAHDLEASCHHHQNNDLAATSRITFNSELCDGSAAFGALGELGCDNLRANSAFNFVFQDNQSLKIGGEYLAQKLKYCFSDGHTRKWMDQWAVGMKYQILFDQCFIDGVVADIYGSYADSRKLKKHALSDTLQLERFIAGSRAFGCEVGFLMRPWQGAYLKLLADYDNVTFLKHYHSDSASNGLGWTAILNQKLLSCLDLNLKAEMRKPFNNYSADLIFTNHSSFGFSSIGLFGRYTDGKSRVASAWTAGIELGLSFGKGSDSCLLDCAGAPCSPLLSGLFFEPAVYMPVVLAIRDERLKHIIPTPPVPPPCVAPSNILALPSLIGGTGAHIIFDAAPYFEGTNLTWTVTSSNPSAISATIDSSGQITIVHNLLTFSFAMLTVSATNECGSATGSIECLLGNI